MIPSAMHGGVNLNTFISAQGRMEGAQHSGQWLMSSLIPSWRRCTDEFVTEVQNIQRNTFIFALISPELNSKI